MSRSSRFVPVARIGAPDAPERDVVGAAAVLTSHGGLTGEVGDPEAAVVPLRDAIAPVRLLPLLTRGGAERFDLGPADLALLVGRNDGSDAAAGRLEALLTAAGFGAADLGIGPSDAPARLRHPAVGSHVALLLAARLLGEEVAATAVDGGYQAPDHPLQREILDRLSNFCGIPRLLFSYERDAGGAWSHHAPLRAVTRIYSALAVPFRAALTDPVAEQVERLVDAMEARPSCLGPVGERLATATGGRLLGRPAEGGFFGLAVRGDRARGVGLWLSEETGSMPDSVTAGFVRSLLGRMDLLVGGEDEALRRGEEPGVESLDYPLVLREV